MDIRPIRNDADHREALIEIDRLWNAPANTPESDNLDVLITLAEAYEPSVGRPYRSRRAIFWNIP